MHIGIPKEIKTDEYRDGLTADSVQQMIALGHKVTLEQGAGIGAGIEDKEYSSRGARIVNEASAVFADADLIVKVKEPQVSEWAYLRRGQILFTYLHLAPDPRQAAALIKSGCIALAYETVTDAQGRLPLLLPMSEVAGRLSIQAGAHYLEKIHGGRGVLLSGVPGVACGKVVIIGGGVVGSNAALIATGMGASVTIIDQSKARLIELEQQFAALQFAGRLHTVHATEGTIEKYVCEADLVIGAVLIAGAAAPKLITRQMIQKMKKGAVIVDVAIDQGGCVEGARPTTHTDPIFVVDGVIHYCVANMPGAVARTSTFALNHATLPYVMALAQKGWQKALLDDAHFCHGLNVAYGKITHASVAHALKVPYTDPQSLLV